MYILRSKSVKLCMILPGALELIILDHGLNIVLISHYLDHGLAFWWI